MTSTALALEVPGYQSLQRRYRIRWTQPFANGGYYDTLAVEIRAMTTGRFVDT